MKTRSSSRVRLPSRPSPCKAHLRTALSLPLSSHLSYLPFATAAQERAASAKVVAKQQVAADISAALQRRLDQAQVPANQRRDYEKWVRFYLDICTKYGDSRSEERRAGKERKPPG